MDKYHLHIGDAFTILKMLPPESVNCCVTSPPYWGLRDYGVEGQLGLEATPEEYVEKMVKIFREVRRVLREDGTLWLNLGDCYCSNGGTGHQGKHGERCNRTHTQRNLLGNTAKLAALKPKDMVGVPWAVAFALRTNGWYLRADIPWIKRNGMPESTKDRPTLSIDHIFLLSKSEKYHYDVEAVKKIADGDTHARYARGRSGNHKWKDGGPGKQSIAKSFKHMRKPQNWASNTEKYHGQYPGEKKRPGVNPKAEMSAKGSKQNPSFTESCKDIVGTRMRRVSDWFLESFQGLLGDENGRPLAMIANTKGFSGAHFATFPPNMVKPCILAACPEGGTVLDPFTGSGTAGVVALKHFRKFVGIELNPTYAKEMAIPRLEAEASRHKQMAIV